MNRLLFGILLLSLFLTACQPAVPLPTPQPLLSPLATAISSSQSTSPLLPATAVVPTAGPTPTRVAGTGSITGVATVEPPDWSGKEIWIYAAPFTRAQDGKSGFFILETTEHPSAPVAAGGSFTLVNVPPGLYVIVAGPTPEEARAIIEGDQPKVFEVKADETLNLGSVSFQ